MAKVDAPIFKQHTVSHTDVSTRRPKKTSRRRIEPMSKMMSFGHRLTRPIRMLAGTKDVDPTYRLLVNVNWIAIISCGNKTANIYVKKLHSLY